MQDKKDEMVGYVESPTLNLRFSLSKQDIEIIQKNMTEKGRAFLTVRSGVAKESKKPYTVLSVWDPSSKGATSIKQSSNDDMPF